MMMMRNAMRISINESARRFFILFPLFFALNENGYGYIIIPLMRHIKKLYGVLYILSYRLNVCVICFGVYL